GSSVVAPLTLRPVTYTVAPASPRTAAMARPAPRLAPVTTATVELRSGGFQVRVDTVPNDRPGAPLGIDARGWKSRHQGSAGHLHQGCRRGPHADRQLDAGTRGEGGGQVAHR